MIFEQCVPRLPAGTIVPELPKIIPYFRSVVFSKEFPRGLGNWMEPPTYQEYDVNGWSILSGGGGGGRIFICHRGMSKQERIYHAKRAIFIASGAGGNDFPKTVCAPHERPVDSIGRYEKAENAYCLRNGISRGGGGQ